jgi:hypothetical protein
VLSEAALSLVFVLAAQVEIRAAQTVPRQPVQVNPRGGVDEDFGDGFEIPLGPGAEGARRVVLPTAAAPALPTDADLSRIEVDAELVRLARQLDAETYAERASARAQIRARLDSAEEIMALLERIQAERGTALVVITHEPEIARRARRRIELRDGLIVADAARSGAPLGPPRRGSRRRAAPRS